MAPERWRQIEELYHAALERGPAVLVHADPELKWQVERLLARDSGGRILNVPATELTEQPTITRHETPRLSAADTEIDSTGPSQCADGEMPERESAEARKRPPWWMYLIAAAFLTHVLFRASVCFWGPEPVGLDLVLGDKHPLVVAVSEGSPAQRTGIRPGDRLLTVAGRPASRDWYVFLLNIEIGVSYRVELLRDGHPLESVLFFRSRPAGYWLTPPGIIRSGGVLASLCYLAIACFIAFMRPKQPPALLGALLLAIGSGIIVIPVEGLDSMWRQLPPLGQVLLWLATFLNSIGAGVFFTFFALFPRPSFRTRWIWVLAWIPVVVSAPVIDYEIFELIYYRTMSGPVWLTQATAFYWMAYLPLTFVMLAIKYRRLTNLTDKRRVRVIAAGLAFVLLAPLSTVLYSVPGFLESAPGASFFTSISLATLLVLVFPVCFAYAILRHQLFDIRLIIRQGLRYAAAQKVLLLALPAFIAVFLLDLYGHKDKSIDAILRDRGWIYPVLAGIAALLHMQRQRWLQALDRRFFREQYNAHEILRVALKKVYAATNLAQVAPAVVKQIEAAMHVQFCAIMEHRADEKMYRPLAICPDQFCPPPVPVESKIVELSKLLAKPITVSPDESNWLSHQLPKNEWQLIVGSGISLIAPIRSTQNDTLILLGKKRSEQPFTSEDVRLVEDITIGLSLLSGPASAKNGAVELCTECPTCGRCYETNLGRCPMDETRLVTVPVPSCLDERFKLQCRIGKGGMGVVYEATDLQLQRKVAIKVISEDRIGGSGAVERFRRESRVLAGFQHPNVVTLFDIGIAPQGRPFLVMELLSGLTLRQELDRTNTLPLPEIRNIVHQVCAALSAAHGRSLVHRDLKPANIFLCDNIDRHGLCEHVRSDLIVKILDFGLAKLVLQPPKGEQSTLFSTGIGQIAGTPAYMPPEVLRGERAQRGSDIWALSVITFEMLTGQNPFADRVIKPVTTYLEGLPKASHEFFKRCFARDSAQRPDSVEMFLLRFDQTFG